MFLTRKWKYSAQEEEEVQTWFGWIRADGRSCDRVVSRIRNRTSWWELCCKRLLGLCCSRQHAIVQRTQLEDRLANPTSCVSLNKKSPCWETRRSALLSFVLSFLPCVLLTLLSLWPRGTPRLCARLVLFSWFGVFVCLFFPFFVSFFFFFKVFFIYLFFKCSLSQN